MNNNNEKDTTNKIKQSYDNNSAKDIIIISQYINIYE